MTLDVANFFMKKCCSNAFTQVVKKRRNYLRVFALRQNYWQNRFLKISEWFAHYGWLSV
tara:strand:- start:107334 stop:107510 length:177 start_codon:yes stop_codon:yes gene_type:complete